MDAIAESQISSGVQRRGVPNRAISSGIQKGYIKIQIRNAKKGINKGDTNKGYKSEVHNKRVGAESDSS